MASLNLNSARDIRKVFSFYEPSKTKDKEGLGTHSNKTNAVDRQREWVGSQNRCVTASIVVLCSNSLYYLHIM